MNWKERAQERWATAIGKMHLMGQMVGWESIRRGMAHEDELAYRHALANVKVLQGGKAVGDPEAEEMGDMILGDRVEQHYHVAKGLGKLAKAGVAAALIGSGAWLTLGVPFLIDALTDSPTTGTPGVIVEPGTDTDWRLGQPVVE